MMMMMTFPLMLSEITSWVKLMPLTIVKPAYSHTDTDAPPSRFMSTKIYLHRHKISIQKVDKKYFRI